MLGAFGAAVGEGGWLYTKSEQLTRAWAEAFARDAEIEMVGGSAAQRVANGTKVPTVRLIYY